VLWLCGGYGFVYRPWKYIIINARAKNGVEQVTADSEATLDCDKDPFDSDSESDDNY